ncbi:hypothetical protein AQUCO_00400564v1 [Aquilegia coerulea]|uniref:DYW domain-containing protein n=1 Tax=Aquilegia coerulea TaxID=218851 RepID=A0A2G5EVI7_AQUCA|nr:hypothetical protein AQUCO_00400564v1 [Aquilegia coerulea]
MNEDDQLDMNMVDDYELDNGKELQRLYAKCFYVKPPSNDVGEEGGQCNYLNEQHQLRRGCWWASVPIPSDLRLTTTNAIKPVGDDDGHYNSVGGRGYSTLNAPRQMPNKVDKRCLFKDNMGYFNVDKDLKKRFNQNLSDENDENAYVLCSVGSYSYKSKLIRACGKEGTRQCGRNVYANLLKSSTPIDVNTYNKILKMFSDCGSMFDAYEIFENKMPEHNLRSWDTMIGGLAKNGHGEDAIDLFTQFVEAGLKPDGEMFMGVFLACSFLCDIDKGMFYFESMSEVYGIVPSMEHYVTVVNMLGSTGNLDEAMDFIERMPFEPNIDVWETLANLCRIHGNIKLGDHCSEIINCLDASRLTDKLKKGIVPGKTCDAKQKKKERLYDLSLSSAKYDHEYTSHHDKTKIFALLRGMSVGHMKEAGYAPETGSVPFTLEEEEKENYFALHSEKIALALSILSSEPRSRVHIASFTLSKDCHDSLKIISKLAGREIKVINDFNHTFRDGLCSCNDSCVP